MENKIISSQFSIILCLHTSLTVKIICFTVGQSLRLEWKSQAVLPPIHAALGTSGFNSPVLLPRSTEQMSLQLYEAGSEGALINASGYPNSVKVLSCFRLGRIDLQYFEYR